MKVYITQHGLRPFRITKIVKKEYGTALKSITRTQYQGEYKLPNGTTRADGKKWVKLNFWFNPEDLYS